MQEVKRNKKSFLELVAHSLCEKLTRDEFTQTIVLFPNKRASLFLNKYLLKECGGESMWAPTYLTISEFFRSLSPIEEADPIDTVCRIYQHYVRLTHSSDTLDYFYGWGERILADFDDLDKNLADAREVFKDLREYESIGSDDDIRLYLDEEQVEQLERFSRDFSLKNQTEIRGRFKRLWNVMYELYEAVRSDLSSDGLAYEGQLFRHVVEDLRAGEDKPVSGGGGLVSGAVNGGVTLPFQVRTIAVVGFNVLDRVEQELFAALEQRGYRMLYYWDYDTAYCRPHEGVGRGGASEFSGAGYFISKNVERFGNELGVEEFDNLRGSGSQFTFLSADTDAIQAQFAYDWLRDKEFNEKTAVVLCDEQLLQPVLYALPSAHEWRGEDEANGGSGERPRARRVNITKGYALTHTLAYAEALSELGSAFQQLSGGELTSRAMIDVLEGVRHGLREKAAAFNEWAQKGQEAVAPASERSVGEVEQEVGAQWKEILHKESYYLVYKTLGRFEHLLSLGRIAQRADGRLLLQPATLLRLIKQVLSTLTVAFHGEPAVGLQVMGVLETRCLDFERVLMLSVGEGILPQRNSEKSFIPFLIRERYGLTTYVRKNSVYAYYFYRLLQRCSSVTLAYNASTSGGQRGEMSRFMSQMLIAPLFQGRIRCKQLTSSPLPSTPEDALIEPMKRGKPFCTRFSPSSLNSYLRCPRKFYYERSGLQMPQRVDGVIDPRDLGTLFHKCSELLYNDLSCGGMKAIYAADLRELRGDRGYVSRVIDCAFKEVDVARTLIVEDTLRKYVELLLRFEGNVEASHVQRFWLKGTEKRVQTRVRVPYAGGEVEVSLVGEIDRLDVADFTGPDGQTVRLLRLIDYKTNGRPHGFIDVDALFYERSVDKDQKYNFQTFLYSYLLSHLTGVDGGAASLADRQLLAEVSELPVSLALYYIPRMSQPDFHPYLFRRVKAEGRMMREELLLDVRAYAAEFEAQLIRLLAEIIDPANRFERCYDEKLCRLCDYRMLCKRTVSQ